jgi:hypothetical protein
MKSAYLMAAMPVEVFVRLLLRNGISFGPAYIFRTLFILQSGVWSTFLAQREKRRFGARIKAAAPPRDPLILVGHWRTGSTLLHQLLNCDPQFAAPTLYQTSYPTSFMSSRRFVEPIMSRLLLPKRPMDDVRLGMDEPIEEEGAIFRIAGLSPFERLMFPHTPEYFLLNDETFLGPPETQAAWDRALLYFVTALTFHTGKRVLLKNPFHSFRIPTLVRLFPHAKFIHIYRDPHVVVPSTVRMWSLVGAENAMRRQWQPPRFEDVARVLDRMLTRVRADLELLAPDRRMEMKFEDLEREPLRTIRDAYERLGLDFSPRFEAGMKQLLGELSAYRKNRYELTVEQKDLVSAILGHHAARDGYGG